MKILLILMAKITLKNILDKLVDNVTDVLNFDFNLQSVTKLLFGQFCVSTPFPLLTMLRNNEQNLRQVMLWVRTIVYGGRGIFKDNFSISHNILSLIVGPESGMYHLEV